MNTHPQKPRFSRPGFVLILVTVLYFINYGSLLFNQGVFFDDWCNFDQTFETMYNQFKSLGQFLAVNSYIHGTLMPLKNGIFLERLIIFLAYFAAVVSIYGVVRNTKVIAPTDGAIMTLFFAVFPVNFSRAAFCNIHYGLSLALFTGAFFLFTIFASRGYLSARIAGAVLLFFSYTMNSLLLFTLLILFWLLVDGNFDFRSVKSISKGVVKYGELIILPILFWVLKKIYYSPFGSYGGYNTLKILNLIKGIPKSLVQLTEWIWQCLLELVQLTLQTPWSVIGILLIATIILWFWRGSYVRFFEREMAGRNIYSFSTRIFIGLGIFILGFLPYLGVGEKVGLSGRVDPYEWTHRHQILWGFGLSFAALYSIYFLAKRFNRPGIVLPLIIGSISFATLVNARVYGLYLADDFRQKALIVHFAKNETVRENTTFLFSDLSSPSSSRRDYRFYEIIGLFEQAFGNEMRYGQLSKMNWPPPAYYFEELRFLPQMNMRNYQVNEPQVHITVLPGHAPLRVYRVLRLTWWRLFSPNRFHRELPKSIELSLKMLGPG